MSMTELLTQELAFLAAGLHAASRTATTYETGAVDMATCRQVLFVVDSGNAGTATGTIDFQLEGCSTSGGSYTLITGTSITQITADNKYALVLINQSKLVSLGLNYRYIKGKLTVGSATTVCAVTLFGSDARFEPTSASNTSAVVQTLNFTV